MIRLDSLQSHLNQKGPPNALLLLARKHHDAFVACKRAADNLPVDGIVTSIADAQIIGIDAWARKSIRDSGVSLEIVKGDLVRWLSRSVNAEVYPKIKDCCNAVTQAWSETERLPGELCMIARDEPLHHAYELILRSEWIARVESMFLSDKPTHCIVNIECAKRYFTASEEFALIELELQGLLLHAHLLLRSLGLDEMPRPFREVFRKCRLDIPEIFRSHELYYPHIQRVSEALDLQERISMLLRLLYPSENQRLKITAQLEEQVPATCRPEISCLRVPSWLNEYLELKKFMLSKINLRRLLDEFKDDESSMKKAVDLTSMEIEVEEVLTLMKNGITDSLVTLLGQIRSLLPCFGLSPSELYFGFSQLTGLGQTKLVDRLMQYSSWLELMPASWAGPDKCALAAVLSLEFDAPKARDELDESQRAYMEDRLLESSLSTRSLYKDEALSLYEKYLASMSHHGKEKNGNAKRVKVATACKQAPIKSKPHETLVFPREVNNQIKAQRLYPDDVIRALIYGPRLNSMVHASIGQKYFEAAIFRRHVISVLKPNGGDVGKRAEAVEEFLLANGVLIYRKNGKMISLNVGMDAETVPLSDLGTLIRNAAIAWRVEFFCGGQ